MTAREALAKAIGALNIVADVVINPDADNFVVTDIDGKRFYVDNEIAEALRCHFQILKAEHYTRA